MLSIRKILIPTDLSESALKAFDLAYAFAEQHDAELHGLYISSDGPGEGEQAPPPLKDRLEQWLSRSKLDHTSDRQRLLWAHRTGTQVPPVILDYAEDEEIDLIVIGTHGHRSLTHPALGGTTGEIVRQADCPVLTIRARSREDGAPAKPHFQRILVPVDFSEHAEQAVRVARELAALYQGRLSLLFVAEERTVPLFSDTGIPGITTLRMDPEITSRAAEALQQLYREQNGPDVPAEYHRRDGHPASEILAFAGEQGTDLIVMSTHGQTGDEAFSLGGVTEKVVRKATCPVLTLKAFGKTLLS